MIDRQATLIGAAAVLLLAAAGCQHAAPAVAPAGVAPTLPPEVSAPTMQPVATRPSAPAVVEDTATEPHVTIDTHGRELDVRQVLDFLANEGHFGLVYSPEIDKKVRLQLNNVPVSIALQTVLSMASLTLESTTEPPKAPASTSVVFYELPVNADSLSVDAIMKRFGVGRGIAELIVKGRTEKP